MSEDKRYFEDLVKEEFQPDVPVELDDKWLQIAKDLINEIPEEREAKIAEFIKGAKSDPYIEKWENARSPTSTTPKYDTDEVAIRFLRAASWDVPTAVQMIRSYLESGETNLWVVKTSVPSRLDRVWVKKLHACFEYRDYYGRRIYVFRPGQWDPSKIPVGEFFAAGYVIMEYLSKEVKTQIAGVTCIVDISGFGFKHLRALGLEEIKCAAGFMSGSFPLWIRKIHLLHHPRIFNILFNMMKPLLDDRVKNNMIFHGSSYEELHKEVPAFLLPASLGGSGELDNEKIVNKLKERDQIFQDLMEHTVNCVKKMQAE